MTKIRITKKFEFEAGHALYGYDVSVRIFMGIAISYGLLS